MLDSLTACRSCWRKVLAALAPEQIELVSFKPKGIDQIRTHAAARMILNGGLPDHGVPRRLSTAILKTSW